MSKDSKTQSEKALKLKEAIDLLVSAIKTIEYPAKFDSSSATLGSPREYVKLYHYLFVDYSPLLADEVLSKHQMELSRMKKEPFMDSVYKLAKDMFEYEPELSRDQYFAENPANPAHNAQLKALMAVDIIRRVHQTVKSLPPANPLKAAAAASSFKAVHGLSKLPTQGLKSARSQPYLNSQAPSGNSLGRSASVSSKPSISASASIAHLPTVKPATQGPKANRLEVFAFSKRLNRIQDPPVLEDHDSAAELSSMVEAARRDQEGLKRALRELQESFDKRLTRLENENLALKQQNKLLNAKFGQQHALLKQVMQLQTNPSTQGSRSSTKRGGNGLLLNKDYSNDDDDDNNRGDTAFKAPLHGFRVSFEDEEAVSSSRRFNYRQVSSTTPTSSTADIVQVPAIDSTTTPTHVQASALFAQNDSSAEGLDDLSLGPNDVTHNMDVTWYHMNAAANANQYADARCRTYLVDRTKPSANRRPSSQLGQIQVKK